MYKMFPLFSFCQWALIVCAVIALSENTAAIRAKRSSFIDEDATIYSELIDRTNRTALARFNLTEEQMQRILIIDRPQNQDMNTTQKRDSQYFDKIREHKLNDIRSRLESTLLLNNSEENQNNPHHEMAAYPICNSEAVESSWLHDNNVTIRFADSLFEPKRENLNLDSAILRLYKVNPNGTENEEESKQIKRCAEPVLDSQIRVTVSIVMRRNKRAERKKRICNTVMMNVSQTGWVEIDIKRAIYIWENVERQQHMQQLQQTRYPIQVGLLMLEVHDEEERPLKPGLFFKPPKCDQAGLAIPWNFYGQHSAVSAFEANEVPRYPRLDVKLIGYASFLPKNHNKQLQQKLLSSLNQQIFNYSKNSFATGTGSEISVGMATAPESEFTTAATETADNLLSSVSIDSAETVQQQQYHQHHNHHKRHLNHHHHRQHHALQETESESMADSHEQSSNRHRHRRHHNHDHQQHHQQQEAQIQHHRRHLYQQLHLHQQQQAMTVQQI